MIPQAWTCGLQRLRHTRSAVAACGLSSAGSAAVVHGLRVSIPRGSKPMPPGWQADSITRPPGQPPVAFLPLAFDENSDVPHAIVSSLAALNTRLFAVTRLTILCFSVCVSVFILFDLH